MTTRSRIHLPTPAILTIRPCHDLAYSPLALAISSIRALAIVSIRIKIRIKLPSHFPVPDASVSTLQPLQSHYFPLTNTLTRALPRRAPRLPSSPHAHRRLRSPRCEALRRCIAAQLREAWTDPLPRACVIMPPCRMRDRYVYPRLDRWTAAEVRKDSRRILLRLIAWKAGRRLKGLFR